MEKFVHISFFDTKQKRMKRSFLSWVSLVSLGPSTSDTNASTYALDSEQLAVEGHYAVLGLDYSRAEQIACDADLLNFASSRLMTRASKIYPREFYLLLNKRRNAKRLVWPKARRKQPPRCLSISVPTVGLRDGFPSSSRQPNVHF